MESRIELFLGDCRKVMSENILENQVDFVAIDPPYGLDKMNEKWDDDKIQKSISASLRGPSKNPVKNIPVGMKFDPDNSKRLGSFLNEVATHLIKVLKPGGFCVVFSQARSCHRVGVAFEDAGFELRDQLIWDYGAGQGKAQGMQNFIKKSKKFTEDEKESLIKQMEGYKTPQLTPTFETIWLCQKPKEGTFVENYIKYGVGLVDFRDGSRKVCFSHRKPSAKEREQAFKHPTLKPVDLMEDLIRIFSKEGDIVLDCFAGSGSTGVAAINLNRKFIGIEKSEHWFNVMSEKRICLTTSEK
tara:strand:- start:83 stop:982 length:900 start_codon:yes stop_codon:yes gene_type:complete